MKWLHYFTLIVFFCSCSTGKKDRAFLTAEEKERRLQQKNSLLQASIRKQYSEINSRVFQQKTKKIMHQLEVGDNGIQIHLLKTNDLLAFRALDKALYYSTGLLKLLDYENEYAFLLATLLSPAYERLVRERLERTDPGEAPFEKEGLFDFGIVEYLNIEREALNVLHSAKYDLRGAISLVEKLRPYEESRQYKMKSVWIDLKDRLEFLREEAALFPPLRDPIVNTEAFLSIKRWARKI